MPSSLLQIEEPSAPVLVGIAKLAAGGESLRLGHDVEYFSMPSRSLLNRCASKRKLPFTWTINPYRGCEFACKYCYARYTHEFMEMRDGLDFEHKIYVKQQTAWLLRQELGKVKPGESIALGTATDPYQPAERRFEITRDILQEFAQHRGLELGIVTKSDMVVRDINVLTEIAKHNALSVSITVTTTNMKLARILEPRAPRPDLRLHALVKLRQAGLRAGVNCAPVLPGITDSPAALEKVVRAASEAGAQFIFASALFLKPCSSAIFLPFLEKEFPHLVENYRKRYAGHAFVSPAYSKWLAELMSALKKKHGIRKIKTDEKLASVQYKPEVVQMALFG